VFFSYFQGDASWVTFEIATTRDANSVLPAVRRSIAGLDSNLFMLEVRPQSTERLLSTLVTSIAVIALLLACVGIYGTIAYAVSRRVPEIGIRMALGASRSDVLRMTFRESLTPVGIGVVFGLSGALLITPVLESMLFGVAPSDPLSITVAAVFLIVAAIAAAVIPARRASHVDPMTALRYE
jgi:ABC-type antimicrobial peptide transport system permease subunit